MKTRRVYLRHRFGNGAHQCPVPNLARTIAQAALEAVWDRIPDVRLTDPDTPVQWQPSIMMHCPVALPVSFDRSAPRSGSRSPALPGGR